MFLKGIVYLNLASIINQDGPKRFINLQKSGTLARLAWHLFMAY